MENKNETRRATRVHTAVSLGLAILLIALIVLSGVIYGCSRPQEIVTPPVVTPEQPETPERPDVTDDYGKELSSGVVYPMPERMYFSAPTRESTVAASGVTLRATVNPANAEDLAVSWSAAFENPSSAWAAGKDVNTYVTLVPSEPWSAIATITCLKAFAEPVIIEVVSRDNPDAAAQCEVHYHWRFKEPVFTVNNSEETLELPAVDPDNSGQYSYEIVQGGSLRYSFSDLALTPVDAVYTVSPSDSPATFWYDCRFIPEFVSYAEEALAGEIDFSEVRYYLLDNSIDLVGSTNFLDDLERTLFAWFGDAGLGDSECEVFLDFLYGRWDENTMFRNALRLEVYGETDAQGIQAWYTFRFSHR